MNESYVLSVLQQSLGNHTRMDNTGNVQFYCPSCKHRKQKLAVNVRNLRYHCWICDERGNNIASFLWKNGFKNEAKKLKSDVGQSRELSSLFETPKQIEDTREENVEFPKKYHNMFVNKNKPMFVHAAEYLYQRGLTDDDFIKYNIHFSIIENRILFPSYDTAGVLNYYVSRSIEPDCFIKYRNSNNSKTEIIFNEHLIDWNKTLYLVEGVFDYITCRQNAVTILGSTLTRNSKLYKKIVKCQTPIVFALDVDANKKMFKSIENIITYNDHVSYIDWGSETRDISEMGTDNFLNFIKEHKVDYDFTSQVTSKLFA